MRCAVVKPIVRTKALALMATLALAACGGGGGGSSPVPPPPATPPPPPPYAGCPSSGASPMSFAAGGAASSAGARRAPGAAVHLGYVPDMLAVSSAQSSLAGAKTVESAANVQVVRELRFTHLGTVTQILHIAPGQLAATMARLAAAPGVRSVSRISYRQALSTTALVPNDPYYDGFPPTTAPYYEAAGVPGQWDMHVIGLGQAWGYSQANTTGSIYPGAIKGPPIAIVDTGADLTHPELGNGKVVYTQCYITLNGVPTQSQYVTDYDGHGTNVAGIAAADTDNALGFAGAGYNTPLMIYRIFPTPPTGGCAPGSTSTQCQANTADEASAITDAVTHGAGVINLSLGSAPNSGETCAQTDPTESNAIENAIAAGVVVVAAAGNEKSSILDCPAGNVGVIAVGASALNDTTTPATEYVASYSNYDASNPQWGLVAPGGDPSSNTDLDDLHWIENIDSSLDTSANCKGDYPSLTGTPDCRVLIAGTSQAAPHVAGAAALLLGVGVPAAQVFSDLCSTADNINDPKQGCGRLDVYHALAKAVGDPSP